MSGLCRIVALILFFWGTVSAVNGPARPTEIIYLSADSAACASDSLTQITDNNGIVTKVGCASLLVYPAPASVSTGRAVIICPGGGYQALDYRTHVEMAAVDFNRAGITVFGLKYRLAPPSKNIPDDALADLQQALTMVRSRSSQWNLAPGGIGVLGYSAGSHLILTLLSRKPQQAARQKEIALPDFAVLLCPWPRSNTIRDFKLSKNTPPLYIAHAKDDKIAPIHFAINLKKKLQTLAVPVTLRLVATGGHHAFNIDPATGKSAVAWSGDVVEWISQATP